MTRTPSASFLDRAEAVLPKLDAYVLTLRDAVRARVFNAGKLDRALLDAEQHAAHGYAWVATTVTALSALLAWGRALEVAGRFRDAEALILELAFGEYIAQIRGGLPMSANEMVRPEDFGLAPDIVAPSATGLLSGGADPAAQRRALADLLDAGIEIDDSVGNETTDAIRDAFRRFTAERIVPHAHRWHLENALVPDDLIRDMAGLGTFGICIPEEFGGSGLGKLEMCVVTEELSRGWIGAGSLGTRSEIAGELILKSGSDAQKSRWLPPIARGDVLPTAVFTEPSHGSDLAGLTTRAVSNGAGWAISGAKTWITHASRSDLMTLLARTGSEGAAGLSMFLLPKPRGTENEPFPLAGLDGGEIQVLGYRGMREYELVFDGLAALPDSLLGGREGEGFRQLMHTFEGARIQTAARAVGVARRAQELALAYARERQQFGRSLIAFPRIADKLAMMTVETIAARELAYFAAREKDKGHRCDIEAGMAKLFAARVAWSNADNALQIHGGNGYALESEVSRILCDARILNIFEGAAEIQAQVIARGLLGRT
jgi:(2S)-methylsuccinyl-CoA dehydrogenase